VADPVILASGSKIRLKILQDAGVSVVVETAVDEDSVKTSMKAEGASAMDTAIALAELKARRVSLRRPGALVLGADQMLECGGVWLDKPVDEANLRAQLTTLRGRTHRLISACVAMRDGERLWHAAPHADVTLRPFSEAFLDWYVAAGGQALLSSVGGYQIEGVGAQLFAKVTGDWFTVMGLPLYPLLDFLRLQGVLTA
jgi:septum formation protein